MDGDRWRTLHDSAFVVDGTCPLLAVPEFVDWYIEGGVDIVTPTVGGFHPVATSFKLIGKWLALIRCRDDLVLVDTAAGARAAKAAGQTGVVFHFQGSDPIEEDLRHVDAFKRLGVGMMQLAYNVESAAGYGAQVRDQGLKVFGRELIQRCNEAGVIVDCSHAGHRTALDAVAASESPVVVSHANAYALRQTESERNVRDELVAAIGESGGIVGVTGFPGFLVEEGQPSLDTYLDHVDHFVSIAGIDHVGLGIDYYLGQHPVVDGEQARREYQREVDSGRWKGSDYPPPPHRYPAGIETPKTLPNVTRAMLERGYSEAKTQAILGLNWLRVYEAVWGR